MIVSSFFSRVFRLCGCSPQVFADNFFNFLFFVFPPLAESLRLATFGFNYLSRFTSGTCFFETDVSPFPDFFFWSRMRIGPSGIEPSRELISVFWFFFFMFFWTLRRRGGSAIWMFAEVSCPLSAIRLCWFPFFSMPYALFATKLVTLLWLFSLLIFYWYLLAPP